MAMSSENEGIKLDEPMADQITQQGETAAEPVDRISSLPDPIAQLILSRLPENEAARSTIWSKRWDMLRHSLPVLNLDERNFQGTGIASCRRKFLYHVERALFKRGNDLSQVKVLRVSTRMPPDDDLERLLVRLLEMAVRDNVPEIELNVNKNLHPQDEVTQYFVLPKVMLSSGSSVTCLWLGNVAFGHYNHQINFPSLKTLRMTAVHASDYMLSKVISGCPVVENVTLEACRGVKTIRFSNRKVKNMTVSCCQELKGFDIDAPALNSLQLNGFRQNTYLGDFSHNESSCCTEISKFLISPKGNGSQSNLKSLTMSYVKIGDKVFMEMLSSNPNVETIVIKNCVVTKIPDILVKDLKVLQIKNCELNQPLDLYAPNIESIILSTGNLRFEKVMNYHSRRFPIMKTLTLVGLTTLTSNSLENFLSCCHALESLSINTCQMLTYINLQNTRLKSLVVEACNLMCGGEIYAPRLVYFKYVGYLLEFDQMVTSSELKAEMKLLKPIDTAENDEELVPMKMKNLLRNLAQAKVLVLVSEKIEYVTLSKDVCIGFPPIYFLSHSTVKTSNIKSFSHIDLISGILRMAFCREHLFITIGDIHVELKFQIVPGAEEMDLLVEGDSHDCLTDHLTEVKIKNLEGTYKDLELIRYLLRKTTILENMLITFSTTRPSKRSFPSPTIPELIEDIKKYPKASPFVKVAFMN